MSDNDTSTPGTVVPFRRPEGTVATAPGTTVEGEVLDHTEAALTVSEPRQTWGTRVLHGTGRVLSGPSDQVRARLAERTIELSHATGTRLRKGGLHGRRALGRTRRFVARHGRIIGKGMESARQRRRADTDHTDLKVARATAKEKGDTAQVEALTRQLNEGRHVRVDTARKWAELAWSVAWKTAAALGTLFVVSVVAGGINGFGHWLGVWNANDALAVWRGALTAVYDAAVLAVTLWWAFPAAWAVVKLSRYWRDGNRLGEQVLPVHLRKQASSTQERELTEGALTQALANIGNTQLKGYIKEGWPNRDTDNAWVQPPIATPKGYHVQIRLPLGVDVPAVRKAHNVLAHNLGCRGPELFLEAAEQDPTVLDLFRLNPGVLREPVDPHPLLSGGTTDYWTGFPIGVTPRGNPVVTPVFERNFVFSGTMGSGKTTMILDLLYGAILDPLVDIDVFVFAQNNDYDQLKPVLNTFSEGGTTENVQACLEHMEGLYAELATRGNLLKKHGIASVNREVAAKEPGLRPRIVVIDECQAFFRQDTPEERRRVVNLLVNFYSAARKYAINVVFATPLPSDQSLPRDLVAVTTNKACGAIGDKTRNNVVLGEKAYENGISALDLKPKTKTALNDTGTLICIGFTDEPGAIRSYYLTDEQKQVLVDRALELRGGGTAPAALAAAEDRDVLADILAVTRDVAVREDEQHPRAGAIAAALATRWNAYQNWQIKDVTEALAKHGYTVPTTQRRFPVDPAKVAEALARRDAVSDE
ncbi:FUSC family protein [Amycolatopsis echigonensis]|uniref:ATP-binding protein n=1 Tax=Amycolatopsis echigonensis TaxID=2576905 RepID=A0A2N3WE81_9PSEU|nr:MULTISPECIES: hypothetical protein [Amycolatopsis]MBB2499661.1 ATP-binding protein [Amycolatopsis echigonensis]PKV92180.1 S-DNA-T family DNA segregation ATPase FtsK/SpoIIIE [Amycolatopsis niigatensis]